jgi:hypothetical protein
MKQNEKKITEKDDNKELIDLDYSYLLLILSLNFILIIVFFKILLNDIFIRFIYKYTFLGVYLRKIKDYLSYNKIELTNEILKQEGGGMGIVNSFDYFNNEMPLSDWSKLSSINF